LIISERIETKKPTHMKRIGSLLLIFLLTASLQTFSQQASLTIINKSNRHLTVKIMKGSEKKFTFYQSDHVDPNGKQTIFFTEPGRYFTKNQAILVMKDTLMRDTLYSKGNPFIVIADKKRGYSNITMKYTVKESKKPVQDGVIAITRKEYEEN
jgi:hypothetical protein